MKPKSELETVGRKQTQDYPEEYMIYNNNASNIWQPGIFKYYVYLCFINTFIYALNMHRKVILNA